MANDPARLTVPSDGATGGFGERLRFLRAMVSSPRRVGSLTPTGRQAATQLASHINPASGLPVLELGPGTGAVTRAIIARGVKPSDIIAVEYSKTLAAHLRSRFASVQVINGNAFDLDNTLPADGPRLFDAVVSGLPLLNFDHASRNKLLNDALDRVAPGRPFVQFTYGAKQPIEPDDRAIIAAPMPWALRNLPPARIWTYRRPD